MEKATIYVDLFDVVNIEHLNDYLDDYVSDYHVHGIPCDISYKVIGFKDNTLSIEATFDLDHYGE